MAKPIVPLTPEARARQRELAARLALLKHDAMAAGLVLTAHALEPAVVTVGYEIAAQESGTWPESALAAVAGRLNEP